MPAFSFRALRTTLAAIAGAVALLTGAPARADLVSFDYTGQASNGATVQGTFGWQTGTPGTPTLIGQGNVVLGQRYDGVGFLTGQVSGGVLDGRNIAASGLTWNVVNMDPACAACAGDELHIIYSVMFVNLFEDTKTALNSLDLPTGLDLSDWAGEHRVRLADLQLGVGAMEDFTLLTLKLSAPADSRNLPEPGSLALLALACACALAARRRAAR